MFDISDLLDLLETLEGAEGRPGSHVRVNEDRCVLPRADERVRALRYRATRWMRILLCFCARFEEESIDHRHRQAQGSRSMLEARSGLGGEVSRATCVG